MSSFTIFDLVNMVICSGAKPVFIDHEKDSFDMNTKNLVSYIEKNHNKIASILLCHYSLNSRNLIKIKDKCSEFEIPIIQDMAISLVSRINGVSISNFSDFSFLVSIYLNFYLLFMEVLFAQIIRNFIAILKLKRKNGQNKILKI